MARPLHTYMALTDLIDKQIIAHSLESTARIKLVRRKSLGGVDLILDPSTAVVFFSLSALPTNYGQYVDNVSQDSWRFLRLLVVFKAFDPEPCSQRSQFFAFTAAAESTPHADAYIPSILQAVEKFKQGLSTAEASGTKNLETFVNYAFAATADEAALFTRLYGDQAEAGDETSGAVWCNRAWLEDQKV